MTKQTTEQAKPAPHAGERIDARNKDDVERWAARLCTSPAELRKAIEAGGPEIEETKRQLFLALVRRGGSR